MTIHRLIVYNKFFNIHLENRSCKLPFQGDFNSFVVSNHTTKLVPKKHFCLDYEEIQLHYMMNKYDFGFIYIQTVTDTR